MLIKYENSVKGTGEGRVKEGVFQLPRPAAWTAPQAGAFRLLLVA